MEKRVSDPQIEATEMGFVREKVRSSVICEELGVEPLLLCVKRSRLRWFGHLVRMPPGHLSKEVFQVRPTKKKQTQDQVERLFPCTGLGTLRDPPVRVS